MRPLIACLLSVAVALPATRLECAAATRTADVVDAAHAHHAPAAPVQDSPEPAGDECAALMCSQAAPAVTSSADSGAPLERAAGGPFLPAGYISPDLTFEPPPPRSS